jgi:uncharacterized protein YraI
MKRKSVRLAVVAVVAALSLAGVSQPASAAKNTHHNNARIGPSWCC